ncbi:MAG: alkaline phosphatase family protein, partial [Pyrinomonadaceae bacterium]
MNSNKRTDGRRVLAVGIDAAEPSLVRELIGRGQMPALRRLSEGGEWRRVASPARVGSGAVWPTFFTGRSIGEHGVYGQWRWRPETMSLALQDCRGLEPFWATRAREGIRIGVMDIPFAPHAEPEGGFAVTEWGAHDVVEGHTLVSPAALQELVRKRPHPFSREHHNSAGPDDQHALGKLAADCLEGAKMRGDLAVRLINETRPDLA